MQNLKVVWVKNGETVVHLEDGASLDEYVGLNIDTWATNSFSYTYEDLDAPPPEDG